jgi:hypothetical protein
VGAARGGGAAGSPVLPQERPCARCLACPDPCQAADWIARPSGGGGCAGEEAARKPRERAGTPTARLPAHPPPPPPRPPPPARRYLATTTDVIVSGQASSSPTHRLQMLALACLWVAAKYEEARTPRAACFLQVRSRAPRARPAWHVS